MKHFLAFIAALFTAMPAAALEPADIVIETDPAVAVQVERRAGNTSKNVYLTVNKQDRVTVKKKCGTQPLDKTKTNVCPLPSIGEWTATSTSIPVPGGCWTDGAWSPSQPPAGACVTPPPVPPVEPAPSMGTKAVPIDGSKIPKGAINAGSATLNVKPTTEIAQAGSDGSFRTVCTTSHMAFDDPIVFPGLSGESHLHTFFGNTGANANSTAESLRTTGNSTCRGGIANRSAYWVPTLIDTKDGTPLVPVDIGTYYKNGQIDPAVIQPMPEGLRMIAGDPANAKPGFEWRARFKCIGGPNAENDKYGAGIGNCDVGAQLWSEVFFPQCWDGVNLDSPDHKGHMSYPSTVRLADGTSKRVCPATHPVALAQVTFNIVYAVTEKDAPLRWRLASDNYDKTLPGGYSSHGDWFNGWQKPISDAWAKGCVAAKKDCHSHLLGDGRQIF